jgi:hypothetical protein
VIYFASGANAAGEIMGLTKAGHPIGIAAPAVTGRSYARMKAQAALKDVRGYGLPLFVDSGAFSAYRRGRPLSAADWSENFALYNQLAEQYGSQLYVVAPDVVADQQATLALLAQYSDKLSTLVDRGVNVIVPLQRGELSLAQMHAAALTAVGRRDVVWGIPSNAAAYEVGGTGEVIDWACAMRPAKVHLLGIGPGRKGLSETVAALASCAPDLEVSTDSNLLRTLRGRKGAIKPMTRAEDEMRAALARCGETPPGGSKKERRWAVSAAVKMAACQEVVLGRKAHAARGKAMPSLNWRGYRTGYKAASQVANGVYVITRRGKWWTAYYGPDPKAPSDDRRRLGRSATYRQTKELAVEYEKALTGVAKITAIIEARTRRPEPRSRPRGGVSAAEPSRRDLSDLLPGGAPDRDEATRWVRRMAKRIMTEQGKPVAAAMAIAWAIYCKYKREQIPDSWGHCKKPPSGYLQKKARVKGARKAARTKKRRKKASRAAATARLRARTTPSGKAKK